MYKRLTPSEKKAKGEHARGYTIGVLKGNQRSNEVKVTGPSFISYLRSYRIIPEFTVSLGGKTRRYDVNESRYINVTRVLSIKDRPARVSICAPGRA